MNNLRRRKELTQIPRKAIAGPIAVPGSCSAADLLEMSKSSFVQTEALRVTRLDGSTPRLFRTPSEEELEAELLNNARRRTRHDKNRRKSLLVLLEPSSSSSQQQNSHSQSVQQKTMAPPTGAITTISVGSHPKMITAGAADSCPRQKLSVNFPCCGGEGDFLLGSDGESPAFSGTSSSGLSSSTSHSNAVVVEKTAVSSSIMLPLSASSRNNNNNSSLMTGSTPLLVPAAIGRSNSSAFQPYQKQQSHSPPNKIHIHYSPGSKNGMTASKSCHFLDQSEQSTKVSYFGKDPVKSEGKVKEESENQPPPIPPKTENVRLLMYRRRHPGDRATGDFRTQKPFMQQFIKRSNNLNKNPSNNNSSSYSYYQYELGNNGTNNDYFQKKSNASLIPSTVAGLKKTSSLSGTSSYWRVKPEKNTIVFPRYKQLPHLSPPETVQSPESESRDPGAEIVADKFVTTFLPQPKPRRKPPVPLPRTSLLQTRSSNAKVTLQRSRSIGPFRSNNDIVIDSSGSVSGKGGSSENQSLTLMAQSMYVERTDENNELETIAASLYHGLQTITQEYLQTADTEEDLECARLACPHSPTSSVSLSVEFSHSSLSSTLLPSEFVSAVISSNPAEERNPAELQFSNKCDEQLGSQQNAPHPPLVPKRRSFRQLKQIHQQNHVEREGSCFNNGLTRGAEKKEEELEEENQEFVSRVERWEAKRRSMHAAAEESAECPTSEDIIASNRSLNFRCEQKNSLQNQTQNNATQAKADQPPKGVLLRTVLSSRPTITQGLDIMLCQSTALEAATVECLLGTSNFAKVEHTIRLASKMIPKENEEEIEEMKAPPIPPKRTGLLRKKVTGTAEKQPQNSLAQNARVIQWVWESNKAQQHLEGTIV